MQHKSIPVRMPEETYRALRELARQSGESMNRLIVKGIAQQIRQQENTALFDSFTLLGTDRESDIESAFAIQREAVGD